MSTEIQKLHERALELTKTYLRAEADLIAILQEIDDRRGYRDLGYKSLFEYAAQGLGLSESVSFNFMTIARKSKEVPKLQEMIRTQEISVSNARTVVPVLTSDNQEKWLAAASQLSKRELEREIAKEFPERQVQEQTRYVSEKRLELKFGISEKLYEEFKRVQDLHSSQSKQAASLEETFQAMVSLYLEKKDSLKKAQRVQKKSEPVPGQVKKDTRYIPAPLQHAVRLRDGGQCTFKASTGNRCAERRWLDFHHIRPMSQGGITEISNLTLLCRGHHQLIHHEGHTRH
jgi:5-methylcytosine-specific restriction endonuclease McrA